MSTDTEVNAEFYTQLKSLLDSANIMAASELLDSLDKDTQRHHYIAEIAHELAHDVTSTRILHNLAHNLANDPNLAHNRELAIVLGGDLDLAYKVAIDIGMTRKLNLNNGHVQNLILGLDTSLVRALDRAFRLSLDRDSTRDLVRWRAYSGFLVKAIEMYSMKTNEPSGDVLTLEGLDTLTPYVLATQLAPYLHALAEMQTVILQARGEATIPLYRIRHISQNSPTLVSVEGISDAIEAVSTIFLPWREANITHLSPVDSPRKTLDQGQRQAELPKQKFALVNVASAVINQAAPDLSEQERIYYGMKLIESLSYIIDSPINIVKGPEQ